MIVDGSRWRCDLGVPRRCLHSNTTRVHQTSHRAVASRDPRRGPDGDDHELQQDPVVAVARRPARALAQNCEQLDRLATDMAHCLEDALRMRCASDVEQS